MRLALLVALLTLLPAAAAEPEGVHLGIPSSDAATTRSVLWREVGPPRDASVTLEGPDGVREVAAREVDGPTVGVVYEAVFDALTPDTTYAYTIDGRSLTFRTPNASLSADRPLRIVALGDMGTGSRAQEAVKAVAALGPDLILHAGDISYAEGRQLEWEAWFGMVEPIAASVPWVTALGNHETYSGSSIQGVLGIPSPAEIAFYQQRFGLPGNELSYSFDWGPVHVVVLDTYSERTIPAAQARWLDEELAAHADAAWTLIVLHEPPWSSNDNHGSSRRVQEAFVPTFEKHGVDLVIAAHDHAYERTHPIGGVTYIVTGGAGRALYTGWEAQPAWSAARDAEHHVTVLDVWPDRIEGRPVGFGGAKIEDAFAIQADRAASVPAAIVTNDSPSLTVPILLVLVLVIARLRR